MTQLVTPNSDRIRGSDAGRDVDFDAQEDLDAQEISGLEDVADTDPEKIADSDPEKIADRIRDRSEEIRRRELETALGRLRASGEVTPEESQAIALLSARLTDALVERWTRKLAEDGVDCQVALELLAGDR